MRTSEDFWRQIREDWNKTVILFNAAVPDSNNRKTGATPDEVARRLIVQFGIDRVKTLFAVVCEAKRGDGRIYDENRNYLRPSLPESVAQELEEDQMAVVKARIGHLDDIHPTHINQTISALKRIEQTERVIR